MTEARRTEVKGVGYVVGWRPHLYTTTRLFQFRSGVEVQKHGKRLRQTGQRATNKSTCRLIRTYKSLLLPDPSKTGIGRLKQITNE